MGNKKSHIIMNVIWKASKCKALIQMKDHLTYSGRHSNTGSQKVSYWKNKCHGWCICTKDAIGQC